MICVVVPAYNEEKYIGDVVRSIKSIDSYFTDVVVVNDGSTDWTSEVAKKAGAIVIDLDRNQGVGAAISQGMGYAFRGGSYFFYDYTVIMAGDGQHRAEDLEKVLAPLKEDRADFVQGTRYASFGWSTGNGAGRFHRMGPLVMSILFWICTGRWYHDPGNGFKAFRSDLFQGYDLNEPGKGFGLEPSLLYWATRDHRVVEVPVTVPNYPRSTIRWKLWKEMMLAPVLLRLGIRK